MIRHVIYPSIMAQTEDELSLLFQKFKGITDHVHLDIADGIAVPNTSLHFPLSFLSTSPPFRAHAHLMVQQPEKWVAAYGSMVEFCIPHLEYLHDTHHFISDNQHRGIPSALAIRPETPVTALQPYLLDLDYVLVLTVNPGFYGASFLPTPLEKVKTIKQINRNITVIVDGGMTPETVPFAIRAGADHIVSGSFLAKAANPQQAMMLLESAIDTELHKKNDKINGME